jgi:mannose-1-phosphate guanylyltransferase / phosphomannomutase
MKAVIMAGGEGSRLRPLTSGLPKPMVPLANRPMMEYVIDLLKDHGVTDIVVTVAYMADSIRSYFGDGSSFGVSMAYATEESPLGTAGSVRNAQHLLDERFLVISGDVLTDIDLGKVVATHEAAGAMATIGLVRVPHPLEFGIVITREDGSIERFLEKPSWGQVFSDTINSGVFVLEPEVFEHIAPNRQVDFSAEVFPALLEDGAPLYGSVVEGYWEDVGTLEAYLAAHRDILDGKVRVHVPGFDLGGGVWMGENTDVHPDATVTGPAIIGDNCRIEAGVHVGPYSVLGTSIRVRAGTDTERSVVGDNTYLGEGVSLRGAVVGRSCDLRGGARLDEGAVLGDECFIGADAHIGSGVKVYPFKTVEPGAVVNSSIVWESRGARTLFGTNGVSGLANVDVTPEFATRVAMAFGTLLKSGSTLVSSRDSSRTARMLKRAMMAGLNATGINVEDLEVASVPITQWIIRRPAISGGFTVRLVPGDPQSVAIRLFDADGRDLGDDPRRKLERLLDREDYRRVFPGEIGDIGFAPRALEHYATAIESAVDTELVAGAGFKVVVDYAYGSTSFAMPNVLAKLGLEALAVNPFMSTAGMMTVDLDAHARTVGDLVRASRSDLGAVFEPGGERLRVIDDTGRVLDGTTTLLALLDLLAGHPAGQHVVLPVSVTDHAFAAVERAGNQVVPTKLGSHALMDAASAPGVGFAADDAGGFIVPFFLPSFDAAAAFALLLELLARSGRRLSEVVTSLPSAHIAHETVVTPWELKGQVMRGLMEQAKDHEVELVDGIKIRVTDGWALALPDPDDPVTHVWAEGPNEGAATTIAARYAEAIRQMVR